MFIASAKAEINVCHWQAYTRGCFHFPSRMLNVPSKDGTDTSSSPVPHTLVLPLISSPNCWMTLKWKVRVLTVAYQVKNLTSIHDSFKIGFLSGPSQDKGADEGRTLLFSMTLCHDSLRLFSNLLPSTSTVPGKLYSFCHFFLPSFRTASNPPPRTWETQTQTHMFFLPPVSAFSTHSKGQKEAPRVLFNRVHSIWHN